MTTDVELFARIEGCSIENSRAHLESNPQMRLTDVAAGAVSEAMGSNGNWSAPTDVEPAIALLLDDIGAPAAGLSVLDASDGLSMMNRIVVTATGTDGESGVDFARVDGELLFVGVTTGVDEVVYGRSIQVAETAQATEEDRTADDPGHLEAGELLGERVLGTVLWVIALYALTRDPHVVKLDLPALGEVELLGPAGE